MPETTLEEWDAFLSRYPNAHLLQTQSWGELKSTFGWNVVRIVTRDAGAQILFKKLPLGLTWAYLPKGPVGENWGDLWPAVNAACRRRRAVFLKVEPDLWEQEAGSPRDAATPTGFRLSPHHIQPPRTLLVNLAGAEDQILSRMKQKTRYNIGLAIRKGVVVRSSNDIDGFHKLMQTTGERDAFGVHSLEYYRRVYGLFAPRGECELLWAEYQEEPLAALMILVHGNRAWYFYGASSNLHRNRMAPYILQWEAMRWARAQGCIEYDLWGVPDADIETLEAEFMQRRDGLWGLYRFKRGFGGKLHRVAAPWDRVYRPGLYAFYRWWVSSR
ncbi:MAG: peptidoglycan bridge formation glycyltransferase FemA/FemB family protein [Chloroflexi bacterium]|nr:peptidoglycan bridge formation glycyltransferase FemA/FemB family protein [Chloroflexota bacterium]